LRRGGRDLPGFGEPGRVCEGDWVKGRWGEEEILKIVDWEPFCEQSEQNVSRAGLSDGQWERVTAATMQTD